MHFYTSARCLLSLIDSPLSDQAVEQNVPQKQAEKNMASTKNYPVAFPCAHIQYENLRKRKWAAAASCSLV